VTDNKRLPDPGDPEEHKAIYQRVAGEVVETIERKRVNGKRGGDRGHRVQDEAVLERPRRHGCRG
jgi:hypothetical protein